jgi:radical SAM protein with 4Fe4S-binding SPASM domain
MSTTLDLLAARTSSLPRILWIELTSRCPFDCIFCTRASLRGKGEHLDFELYRRLIDELERPQILRLNYAGESGHYPRLAEAIALAAATGAQVELVSALASLKPERLQAALDAGLNRLTVSLHTLDPDRFDAIYRFGKLSAMFDRLQQVLDWRARLDRPFVLDLAFVAMQSNLDELPAIAELARDLGIGVLAVHPLIGRDPLPLGAAVEHASDGSLTSEFSNRLRAALAQAQQCAPQLAIQLSSYELSPTTALAPHPQPWPWPLPAGARIDGCDQSPFETAHILADGSVVVCEVTEKLSMGNLRQHSLREIWHSAGYQAFRERHLAGSESACRSCSYKRAHLDAPPRKRIDAQQAPPTQLLRGWHADDGSGVRWASAQAALWLPRSRLQRHVRLRGQLARPAATDAEFTIRIAGQPVHRQGYADSCPVDLRLQLPAQSGSELLIELECSAASSPNALGAGSDVRELGFALISAECCW